MNWLFYVLLAGNGLFFGWQWLAHGRERFAAPVVDLPISDSVRALRLLDEVDPGELYPRDRAGADGATRVTSGAWQGERTEGNSASSTGVASCYSLGPIATEDEAQQLRSWVIAEGGAARWRRDERRERSLYWVYLPPFATRAEAVRVAQGMKRAGINDIFVIPRGDMARAVSLGVYSHDASLERRLRQLNAKGYDALVLPRYRVESISWIDAQFPEAKGFADEHLRARFPEIDAGIVSCEALASERHHQP